jgi:hypothetical protein
LIYLIKSILFIKFINFIDFFGQDAGKGLRMALLSKTAGGALKLLRPKRKAELDGLGLEQSK